MYCKKCGKELQGENEYCSSCAINTSEVRVNNSSTPKKKGSLIRGIFMVLGGIFAFMIVVCVLIAIFGDDSTDNNDNHTISSNISNDDVNDYFKEKFGMTEEEAVKQMASYEIKKELRNREKPVYELEILDNDDYNNYIVGAITESGVDVWWRVLVKLDMKTEQYKVYCYTAGMTNDDGKRIARDDCINEFKTRERFGWGKENHIEAE